MEVWKVNKKVLIIDDEKNIRMTLRKSLEKAGYEVETAINGEDGLEKFGEEKYPVIILDMKLPGINGIEVLRRINEQEHQSKIIMITGYGSIDTAVEAMKQGAVDYLRKPFKTGEILEIVGEVFARFELEEREKEAEGFKEYLNLAKAEINRRNFDKAIKLLKKATSANSEKPEPFNLLGVIYELRGDHPKAMKMYRTALSLDPTYRPADDNLQRASEMSMENKADIENRNLGDEDV